MNEFTYIYDGQTHTDATPEFMAKLGINEETQESIIRQQAFETEQAAAQRMKNREMAYKSESDPLFLEALRKSAAGDEEGAEVARTLGLRAVEQIQAKYPI
ncbi:hypothetical protein MSP8886_01451 [Marinomonas spartinae]|uniref:Uncharacterized protein n=1 Tax=Marinomonas spartinae TaxID=1792290 RepID=A0A1A8T9I9_9GAMM|nr:hypothetical protein [Marinomonas spartinae]SBS29133.1 hypothetical protein MSP8886_01451 [Marinomonas spartinae]